MIVVAFEWVDEREFISRASRPALLEIVTLDDRLAHRLGPRCSEHAHNASRDDWNTANVLLWRDNDLNHSIRSKAITIGRMLLGVPVPKAASHLAKKIEATMLGEMPEIADQVGDGMFVTGAAVLLKHRDRFCRPGNMVSLIDQFCYSQVNCLFRYTARYGLSLQGIKFFLAESRGEVDFRRSD